MTAPLRHPIAPAGRADALKVFELRCWARSYLWAAGEFDLHEAVDKLQDDAVRDGLVDAIGQDAVQSFMRDAFHRMRPYALVQNPPDVDFLQRVIDYARPQVADQSAPTKERVETLWAYAKHSRGVAAFDVLHDAFMQLAIDAGLIGANGWWLPKDVRNAIRRHGREDIEHIISWALLGQNPFETGPLQ